MEPFGKLSATAIPLLRDDIDTDQIIPAQFLTVTDKVGLGQKLFYAWRYRADGTERPDFALNQPEYRSGQVLVAGDNFGCGSSREHAPWALADWGIRAVVAGSFADIFRANALKNGIVPIVLDRDCREQLAAAEATTVSIDLEAQTVTFLDRTERFEIEPFAKQCLCTGVDELGYLLSCEPQIAEYEAQR